MAGSGAHNDATIPDDAAVRWRLEDADAATSWADDDLAAAATRAFGERTGEHPLLRLAADHCGVTCPVTPTGRSEHTVWFDPAHARTLFIGSGAVVVTNWRVLVALTEGLSTIGPFGRPYGRLLVGEVDLTALREIEAARAPSARLPTTDVLATTRRGEVIRLSVGEVGPSSQIPSPSLLIDALQIAFEHLSHGRDGFLTIRTGAPRADPRANPATDASRVVLIVHER
jgi:hypothetical protein